MPIHITQDHLRFWQQRKAPMPSWAPKPKGMVFRTVPLIHTLINSQVEHRRREHDAGNLIAILRLVRKRGELIETLERIAKQPGTVINPARRASYARKWLAKLKKEH